jgi:hypothetical protein
MKLTAKGRNLRSSFQVLFFIVFGLAQSAPAGGRDSVVTTVVEPGVTHLLIHGAGPNVINALVVDLKAKNLRIDSYRPIGLVPTSAQAARNDREGHRVVGAVNADFFSFSTGWPVSNQVLNGQIVLGTSSVRSHFLIDGQGKPHFDKITFDGWLQTKHGKRHQIDGVNDVHRNNAIVLHNSFSDTARKNVGPGKTIPLKLLSTSWSVGDTLKMLAGGEGVSDLSTIPQREAVLWIGSAPAVWGVRDEISQGDTILVFLGFHPSYRGVRSVVGGVGMIVSNGQAVDETVNMKERMSFMFFRARHPRTFVGIDRDTTRVFICTVDGRQAASVGMNYREMAETLIGLGVWNATNLDGGGSTTMVLLGKIVNTPSDKTGERPVANSLQIIRIDPPRKTR